MEIDPLTIFAVGGVASLLIERFFYYKSKYKERKIEALPEPESDNPGNPENPTHGERIAGLEKGQELLEKSNEKDHRLIRADIKKLFNLLNGIRRK